MKYAALPSAYYLRPAIAQIDAEAEAAWLRSVAVAAAVETSGFISEAALPSLIRNPTRGRVKHLIDQLVGAGLWLPVAGGWEITGWDEDQAALDDAITLQRVRAAAAAKKRRQRANRAGSAPDPDGNHAEHDPVDKPDSRTSAQVNGSRAPRPGDVSRDMSRGHPATKKRRSRRSTAAAAADGPPTTPAAAEPAAAPGLPEPVQLLRARLELAGLHVRWDTLDPSEVTEIEALIGAHQAPALVRAALAARAAHRNPPAYARAWLATWRSLPPPGRTLALAPCPDTRCTAGWLPDDPETGAPNPCPSCKPHTRGVSA